ncbi:class B sortase [Cytobacillus sp.]|uniref:class B sortase n=1 Tax=Cytobacillus sp. TaxID=2675269 RepID=UPI0028BD92E3|nr:class B sortase [Cytobacillus sp.]
MSRIKKFFIAFFTVLLVFSLVSIAKTYVLDYVNEQQMKELAEIRNKAMDKGEGATPSPFITNTKAHEPAMLSEFQELYKRNPDIVGWLKIDDTRIDYPIMQNQQDAQYYLNHDFDKERNKNGLPFLDEYSHIDHSDILLIHGHHMNSGAMFADLMKYKKESYYMEHPTFQFSTLYEKEEYEIVAVILSKVYRKTDEVFKYYQISQVDTSAEFNSYIENIQKLALYDTGVTAQYGDKLIVLSTCEYSTKNGRLAVVARKRK